jgi:glycosyltransferase involved in cell wall biosynthesis
MGKPLLATDVPGCREIVRPHMNGLLIPPKNAPAAVAALDDLLSDPERLINFGRCSRKFAESEFDVNVVNDRIITELYGLSGWSLENGGSQSAPLANMDTETA